MLLHRPVTLAEASPYSPFGDEDEFPEYDYGYRAPEPQTARTFEVPYVAPQPVPEPEPVVIPKPEPEPVPEPLPSIDISGLLMEGNSLEVAGNIPANATYQWYVISGQQWNPIPGANLSSFYPTNREAGHYIGVTVSIGDRSVSAQTPSPILYYMSINVVGVPKEGSLLKVEGVYPPGTTFQWFVSREGRFDAILDATKDTYIPTRFEVGYPLVVVAAYQGQQTQSVTAAIQKTEVDVKSFKVTGGPYHTNTLSFNSTYYGPNEGNSVFQWLHADTDDNFKPIPGENKRAFTPSADDLHANIALDYTPVSVSGEKAQTFRIHVDSNNLTIDPYVASTVEGVVKTGEGRFEVGYIPDSRKVDKKPNAPSSADADAPIPHFIEATNSKVIIRRQDGSVLAKASYSVDFGIYLSHNDNRAFRLVLSKTDGYDFVAADHKYRDIIALSLRSFLSITVLLKGKIGVHRVQSLSELRNKQNEAKKKLGQ